MAYSYCPSHSLVSFAMKALTPVFLQKFPFIPETWLNCMGWCHHLIQAKQDVPHDIFPPLCPFFLCDAVALTVVSLTASGLFFSPDPPSVLLLPFSLSKNSYFISVSPFSAGLTFTSSTSQKFSALSLAVGLFWVSGSHITDSAGLLTGYSDFVPGFELMRLAMGQQGEELSLCSGNWVAYLEGCENLIC